MKTRLTHTLAALLLATSLAHPARGQTTATTAFTYQGQLILNGAPANNGTYDFKFRLYESPVAPGGQIGSEFLVPGVLVASGIFTVQLNFGSSAWTSCQGRWLEIDVKQGAASYVTLTPRTEVTPTPYAIDAYTACTVAPGAIGNAQLGPDAVATPNLQDSSVTRAKIAPGQVVTSLNGLKDDVTLSAGANVTLTPSGNGLQIAATGGGTGWGLSGNGGTIAGVNFLGTTNNKPLTLKVNNIAALQIRPGVTLPNIVGGLAAFKPSVLASNVSGVVIAGGNAPSGSFNGIGVGDFMAAFDDDGTIGGGFGNKVGSDNADVTDAAFATVGGGIFNGASGFAATVGSGAVNSSSGSRVVVAGGNGNQAAGDYSSIGGGIATPTFDTGDRF